MNVIAILPNKFKEEEKQSFNHSLMCCVSLFFLLCIVRNFFSLDIDLVQMLFIFAIFSFISILNVLAFSPISWAFSMVETMNDDN